MRIFLIFILFIYTGITESKEPETFLTIKIQEINNSFSISFNNRKLGVVIRDKNINSHLNEISNKLTKILETVSKALPKQKNTKIYFEASDNTPFFILRNLSQKLYSENYKNLSFNNPVKVIEIELNEK